MDAFRTRKTFHELYLHRVVLENDSQCWSVTGADQWNVGIILMSIAKNSNTLPAEKRMEVMNSTPQFSTSWKPLKAQSCGWQQSRDDSTNQFEALRTLFSLGFCKRQTSYLFELCITRWFLIDSRLLVKCKVWLSMTVASCCLYLLDHPKFGQGSLQNFNLMNLRKFPIQGFGPVSSCQFSLFQCLTAWPCDTTALQRLHWKKHLLVLFCWGSSGKLCQHSSSDAFPVFFASGCRVNNPASSQCLASYYAAIA